MCPTVCRLAFRKILIMVAHLKLISLPYFVSIKKGVLKIHFLCLARIWKPVPPTTPGAMLLVYALRQNRRLNKVGAAGITWNASQQCTKMEKGTIDFGFK